MEADAKRGACEFATCLYLHIEAEAASGMRLFFSHNCGSLNRNWFVVAMYWNALRKDNVQTTQRVHTQNENDSVHSTDESVTKNVNIYLPEH